MFQMENYIEIDVRNLKKRESLDQIQKFWLAIMSMDVIEFFSLLKEDINLFGYSHQSFTEELHRKFYAHNFFGDNELVLQVNKETEANRDFIDCDFIGVETGFSTVLRFYYFNRRISGISFMNANFGWDIENVFDLYSFDELRKKVFLRKFELE